jgi:hypothetical protein
MGVGRSPKRLLVAGIVGGLAIGAAVGASTLTGASSGDPDGPGPVVLHVARVLADPDEDLSLTAGLFCAGPDASTCDASSATAHILPSGAAGWTDVRGVAEESGYRFDVPGALVPADGFAYWLEFGIQGGYAVRFPDSGPATPFRVVTTAGLREVPWPGGSVDLAAPRTSDSVVTRLGYGDETSQVGRIGGVGDEQPLGPSSFDIGPDGAIFVADWIHTRVMVLSARGQFRRALPLPTRRPVDVAIGEKGEVAVTTLGLGATAFELAADGRAIGRYRVPTGVVERIALTPDGPFVWTGPAQWVPVRSRAGVALPAEAQSRSITAAVPAPDGTVALSQELPGRRVAFVWARPDGSRSGAVLQLPSGVQPGVDYFVNGTPDGGAIAARGLWSESGSAVALIRFAADGSIVVADVIAPPTQEMDAASSTVRFRAPDEVLVAYGDDRGFRIDRFEVDG